MNCLILVILTLLGAATLPVEITTNTGESLQGDLVAITESGVELKQSGKVRVIATESLQSLTVIKAEERGRPPIQVTLIGGSHLRVDQVQTDHQQMVIEARRQPTLSLPMDRVKAIRYRKPSSATDATWLGMIAKPARGDLLVIRRPGDRIDPTEGIITGISDGKVHFKMDGDTVAAPTRRLEGVIFGGTDRVTDSAEIIVTDLYGSTWAATSLLPSRFDQESDDPSFRIQLDSKTIHGIPADLVHSIRWSGGLMMLANTPPAQSSVRPTLPIKWKDGQANAWFGIESASGEVNSGDTKTMSPSSESHDLVLRGGASVTYRVKEGYRLLSGTVCRSKKIQSAGGVVVRIKLEDKVVWEEGFPDAQPRGFELELRQARRVTIEVDAGDDGDLGAVVRMIRPRLIK